MKKKKILLEKHICYFTCRGVKVKIGMKIDSDCFTKSIT